MTKNEIEDILERQATQSTSRSWWRKALNGFRKLKGKNLQFAIEGLNRHIKACQKQGIAFEVSAFTEIIEDAGNSRRVWLESDNHWGE